MPTRPNNDFGNHLHAIRNRPMRCTAWQSSATRLEIIYQRWCCSIKRSRSTQPTPPFTQTGATVSPHFSEPLRQSPRLRAHWSFRQDSPVHRSILRPHCIRSADLTRRRRRWNVFAYCSRRQMRSTISAISTRIRDGLTSRWIVMSGRFTSIQCCSRRSATNLPRTKSIRD